MAGELITVFGGSGFIGRHLIRRLAKRGIRVRAGVREPNLAGFLKPMGDVGQIEPVQVNIRYPSTIARALKGADYAINLVGILNESGPQKFDAVHHAGVGAIARAARAEGVKRLIHVSAIGADPDSPSKYGRSKAAGEAACREEFPEATILRPSLVFGPEDDFFNRFAALARFLPALPLIGGGETRFQPVYVGDVADAILAALDDPATAGAIYELGGPRIYSFRELMALVLQETERRRLLLPVPVFAAKIQAAFLQLLPKPLLTVDQVNQLQIDNVPADDLPGLADLGIANPTSAEVILPSYLHRYRRTGQFDSRKYA
ncbi:MAG TPA: complex I NDUFA9 subunit family protein [Alphaproteobacteria bacterium]|nr:complex I NDUFA9 subunit family protein [Alphaproteobacteria bacterium]